MEELLYSLDRYLQNKNNTSVTKYAKSFVVLIIFAVSLSIYFSNISKTFFNSDRYVRFIFYCFLFYAILLLNIIIVKSKYKGSNKIEFEDIFHSKDYSEKYLEKLITFLREEMTVLIIKEYMIYN